MMFEAFDPTSRHPARHIVAAFELSDAALRCLEPSGNVRRYVERLLADGYASDAAMVIAHSLPAQYLVAWCCECVRSGLEGSGREFESERAAIALSEQCLRDPTDENRALCLEFAERGRHASAGAWLATAASWADGNLAPPGVAPVAAPQRAVAEAVVAALKFAAARSGGDSKGRLRGFAQRALILFGSA
jgi:hypothetical protein